MWLISIQLLFNIFCPQLLPNFLLIFPSNITLVHESALWCTCGINMIELIDRAHSGYIVRMGSIISDWGLVLGNMEMVEIGFNLRLGICLLDGLLFIILVHHLIIII